MLTDNGDGTVTRTGLPEEAKKALGIDQAEQAGKITRRDSAVDESHMRQLALQYAVETHGKTCDEDQVVNAADAYLDFLTSPRPPAAEE